MVDIGLGVVWPWVVYFGGPALAALITPGVAEQRTFFGVFLATLAWSSGIAASVFVVRAKPLGEVVGGVQLAIVAFICLFTGGALAIIVGLGAYGVEIPFGSYGSTPWGWVAPFVYAAVATFGVLGALIGAASGIWAGIWAADLYKNVQPASGS